MFYLFDCDCLGGAMVSYATAVLNASGPISGQMFVRTVKFLSRSLGVFYILQKWSIYLLISDSTYRTSSA